MLPDDVHNNRHPHYASSTHPHHCVIRSIPVDGGAGGKGEYGVHSELFGLVNSPRSLSRSIEPSRKSDIQVSIRLKEWSWGV